MATDHRLHPEPAHDSAAPLAVALLLALLIHGGAFMWMGAADLLRPGGDERDPKSAAQLPDPAADAPQPPKVTPGQDEADLRPRMAWISYDDFQVLQSPAAGQPQPLAQQDAAANPLGEAVPDPADPVLAPPLPAPLPSSDPTWGGPNIAEQPRLSTGLANDARMLQVSPSLPTEPAKLNPSDLERGLLPASEHDGEDEKKPDAPPQPDPAQGLAPAAQVKAETPTAPPTGAQQQGERKITRVPRTEKSSPPMAEVEADAVRPGKVVTGRGIEFHSAVPQWSIIARSTSLPDNMKVAITFDPSGEAINAEILQSSGYPNIDAPVRASLFKWRASGEKLKEQTEPFTLKIDLILVE